jgi:hypothetical protein
MQKPKSAMQDVLRNETGHQRRWRKTYSFLGFNKGYNLPLYIIFGGAFVGFCLARMTYLNINNYRAGASPGELNHLSPYPHCARTNFD